MIFFSFSGPANVIMIWVCQGSPPLDPAPLARSLFLQPSVLDSSFFFSWVARRMNLSQWVWMTSQIPVASFCLSAGFRTMGTNIPMASLWFLSSLKFVSRIGFLTQWASIPEDSLCFLCWLRCACSAGIFTMWGYFNGFVVFSQLALFRFFN